MPQPARRPSASGSPGSGRFLFRRVSEPEPPPGSTVRVELGPAPEHGQCRYRPGNGPQAQVRPPPLLLQRVSGRLGVAVKFDLWSGCGVPAVTRQIKADGVMPQSLKMYRTVVQARRRRARARRWSWLWDSCNQSDLSMAQISAAKGDFMDDLMQSRPAMPVEFGVVLIGAGIAVGLSLAAAVWFERWKQRQP